MSEEKILALRAHARRYAGADDARAWATLGWTALGYAAATALYLAGWWPLAVLAATGVLVRTFIIYHDAIHRSFFARREWNERLVTVLQVVTLTPVKLWRANHLAHHGRFGDLGFRDIADTIFFTRREFEAMPPWKRRFWRVARTPWVFFTVLPLAQWLVEYPFFAANAWIWSGIALHAGFAWFVSPWHLLALYLTMVTGLTLFHLQHGIGPGYRAPTERWSFEEAAIKGSTWVPIPRPFTWCTLGIEFHHVHHLNPGVPCYRIAACHREAPPGAWSEVTRGTWRNCWQAMGHVMWDTERGELARF